MDIDLSFVGPYVRLARVILNKDGQFDHFLRIIKGLLLKNVMTDMSVMGSGKTYIAIMTVPYILLHTPSIEYILQSSSENIFSAWKEISRDIYERASSLDPSMTTFVDAKGVKRSLLHHLNFIYSAFNSEFSDLKASGVSTYSEDHVGREMKGDRVVHAGKSLVLIRATDESISTIGLGYMDDELDRSFLVQRETAELKRLAERQAKYSSKKKPEKKKATKTKYKDNRFNIESLNSIDVNRFAYDVTYSKNENSYFFDQLIGDGKVYFLQDEFQQNSATKKHGFYTMAMVNILVEYGSYVLNISGTPSSKPKDNFHFYSMNALYYPSHGLIARTERATKTRAKTNKASTITEDMFNPEGINAIYSFLVSAHNNEVALRVFGVDKLSDSQLRKMKKKMDEYIGMKVTIDNVMRFSHYFLKEVNKFLISIVDSDMGFTRHRVLHRYMFPMLHETEYFKAYSGRLIGSDSFVSRSVGGGGAAPVGEIESISDSNLVLFNAIKALELLRDDGNMVMIFLSNVKNMEFIKELVIALAPMFDVDLSPEEVSYLYSPKSAKTSSPSSVVDIKKSIAAGKSRLILLSYKSGSTGISLNEPIDPILGREKHVTHVIVNATYKDSYQQALSRSLRSGIVNKVHIHVMINNRVVVPNMMRSYYNVLDMHPKKEILPVYGMFSNSKGDLSDLGIEEALTIIKDKEGVYVDDIFKQYDANISEENISISKAADSSELRDLIDKVLTIFNENIVFMPVEELQGTFEFEGDLVRTLAVYLAYVIDSEHYEEKDTKIFAHHWVNNVRADMYTAVENAVGEKHMTRYSSERPVRRVIAEVPNRLVKDVEKKKKE